MRLGKHLAHAGIASRRASEEIVRAGRVTVAGEVVTDPARDVQPQDDVRVDGARVGETAVPASERAVYVVNKPAGVVSTAKDTHGRRTVVSLVPSARRLYPVGRLDADTTGLILLTDDGDLAHRLTHPSFEVPKTYLASVDGGRVAESDLRRLRDGVTLDDGRTAPARVRQIAPGELELTIHEGRKRQVKRMCEAVGHRVKTLRRVAFGPLRLDGMKPGEYRRLTPAEVERLRGAGSTKSAPGMMPSS
jgi:23S rRNA pseudouridine2605 synthase